MWTSMMDPDKLLAQRRKQVAQLARYGRRSDLLDPDTPVMAIKEAVLDLNELHEEEDPTTQVREMT